MAKYKFLLLVFLISGLSRSVASQFDFNVQLIYRIPFINIRWIDVVIIAVIFYYFYNSRLNKPQLPNQSLIIQVCFFFLCFETFQLIRSWHAVDLESQISRFLCVLTVFIIMDLSTFKLEKEEIITTLKKLAMLGSIVLLIANTILFFSFISGRVVFGDSGIRVGLNASGMKEVVSTDGFTTFVYVFDLYFLQNKSKLWEKLLFIATLLSILLSVVFSFGRGILFTLGSITLIYNIMFSKNLMKTIINLIATGMLLVSFYLIFGKTLAQKGYDPVMRITQIAEFALDKDNPDWDKGRSLSRKYALDAWEKNPWIGVGYDDLSNYGLPEGWATAHNFVITSLFHRGIIGTFLYLLILFLSFKDGINYWIRTRNEHTIDSDVIKLLIMVTLTWLIVFWNQEIIWEKYSLALQLFFMGLISNYYKQPVVAGSQIR